MKNQLQDNTCRKNFRPRSKKRRGGNGKKIEIIGATENNLKILTLQFR
jgi:hypothetical protein